MKAKTLGSAILCTTALLASLAGGLMAQAPTTESQTSQSDVSALKAQLAEQQKQIDELKAALKEQMKLIERTASTTAPAADAQQKQDFALPRNKALGEVASASPIIPPAPAPVAPAVLSGAQGGGSKNPCEAPPDANAVPPYLRIGNVCVVPIGFLDATYVWRDKNAQSSIGTNFGSIPYNNTTNSKLSENRFSPSRTRGSASASTATGRAFISSCYNENLTSWEPAAPTTSRLPTAHSFPASVCFGWTCAREAGNF